MDRFAVVARALVYATAFVWLVLVFLPARVLERAGLPLASPTGALQWGGWVLGLAGALLMLSCVLAFAWMGRGTPAPFDPPRALVVSGPYRFVRNPMYLGAVLVLLGWAVYFESLPLAGLAVLFLLAAHLFVVGYEEPKLRRVFGGDYLGYCGRVGRWIPGRPTPAPLVADRRPTCGDP